MDLLKVRPCNFINLCSVYQEVPWLKMNYKYGIDLNGTCEENGAREINELVPPTDRHFGQSRPKPPIRPPPPTSSSYLRDLSCSLVLFPGSRRAEYSISVYIRIYNIEHTCLIHSLSAEVYTAYNKLALARSNVRPIDPSRSITF